MKTNTQLATPPASSNNGQLFAPKLSALNVMASRFNVEPQKLLSTLKNTVFKGASDDELLALVVVANEYGLNPMTKEIYAFPAKGGGIVPVVSVDGWNNLANSHPQMDGMEFEFAHDEKRQLVSCTCVIWRKDRNRPIKVTEYLSECKRNTEPWKMEHRMLRHKALIQCARVAFGFSGVYDEDDSRVASGRVVEVATAEVPPMKQLSNDSEKMELGGSANMSAAPAGATRNRQAKPAAKPETPPLTLEESPPSLVEVVGRRLLECGATWERVATIAEAGGLFVSPSVPLTEQPSDVLQDVVNSWPALLVELNKEGA